MECTYRISQLLLSQIKRCVLMMRNMCYFDDDKLFGVQESTDQEKKLHILSRLEMTEPKWEFVK